MKLNGEYQQRVKDGVCLACGGEVKKAWVMHIEFTGLPLEEVEKGWYSCSQGFMYYNFCSRECVEGLLVDTNLPPMVEHGLVGISVCRDIVVEKGSKFFKKLASFEDVSAYNNWVSGLKNSLFKYAEDYRWAKRGRRV